MPEIFEILSAKGSASSNHALPTGAPCVSFEVQGKMTKGNIWIFWTKNTNPQPSVNQDGHGKSISRKPSVDDFSSFSCGWDVPISRRPHLLIVGGMDCCVEGDHVGSHAQRIGIEEEGLLRKFH